MSNIYFCIVTLKFWNLDMSFSYDNLRKLKNISSDTTAVIITISYSSCRQSRDTHSVSEC
ncbi:unnamed protein product [Acanthoscelides obtectus]|uniref:Uncharacterized protein n=1 Tax=Acanthoscelides obtectus TaxID=200917 RepID=A0A9P0KMC4_ACAOB|nr:unnamed protein product [Acanthoscelides obtectus]CAK1665350.1 hypothetical protein AOBTE_LOCUS24770 [Acanthoscelides obtectus]